MAKRPDIKAKIPNLPSFIEGRDNMDSYLKRYERFVNGQRKNGPLLYPHYYKVRH